MRYNPGSGPVSTDTAYKLEADLRNASLTTPSYRITRWVDASVIKLTDLVDDANHECLFSGPMSIRYSMNPHGGLADLPTCDIDCINPDNFISDKIRCINYPLTLTVNFDGGAFYAPLFAGYVDQITPRLTEFTLAAVGRSVKDSVVLPRISLNSEDYPRAVFKNARIPLVYGNPRYIPGVITDIRGSSATIQCDTRAIYGPGFHLLSSVDEVYKATRKVQDTGQNPTLFRAYPNDQLFQAGYYEFRLDLWGTSWESMVTWNAGSTTISDGIEFTHIVADTGITNPEYLLDTNNTNPASFAANSTLNLILGADAVSGVPNPYYFTTRLTQQINSTLVGTPSYLHQNDALKAFSHGNVEVSTTPIGSNFLQTLWHSFDAESIPSTDYMSTNGFTQFRVYRPTGTGPAGYLYDAKVAVKFNDPRWFMKKPIICNGYTGGGRVDGDGELITNPAYVLRHLITEELGAIVDDASFHNAAALLYNPFPKDTATASGGSINTLVVDDFGDAEIGDIVQIPSQDTDDTKLNYKRMLQGIISDMADVLGFSVITIAGSFDPLVTSGTPCPAATDIRICDPVKFAGGVGNGWQDEEMNANRLLSDIAFKFGIRLYLGPDNKYYASCYDRYKRIVAKLTESSMLDFNWWLEPQDQVIGSIVYRWDYDLFSRRFEAGFQADSTLSIDRTNELVIENQFVETEESATGAYAAVAKTIQADYLGDTAPRLMCNFQLDYSAWYLFLGDFVSITHSALPTAESAGKWEIIQIDYDGQQHKFLFVARYVTALVTTEW